MKKGLVVLANIAIVIMLVIFVNRYVRTSYDQEAESQRSSYTDMTVAMRQMIADYLQGEQRVCNSWAYYINDNDMTMAQAIEYVRGAATSDVVTGHIVYIDDGSLSGLSTRARVNKKTGAENYEVSYASLSILNTDIELQDKSEFSIEIHMTRSYTNPSNGTQCVAFCAPVTLRDAGTGEARRAMLIRSVPVSSLSYNWKFPTENYADAEIALITADGSYIIKSSFYKNSNFYEFYDSYNTTDINQTTALKQNVSASNGCISVKNSKGQDYLMAYAPGGDWIMLSCIPVQRIVAESLDLTPVVVTVCGLALLILINVITLLAMNRQLRIKAQEAAVSSRAKTDFLSTMSHDIRTPMNAIIGMTTLAMKDIDDREAVKSYLRKMSLASNHLLTLINDILDISKIESGSLKLSPAPASLADVIENLVSMAQPTANAKKIDLRFYTHHIAHEQLVFDQLRVNQVYINLVSNAVKYTGEGGRVSVSWTELPCEGEPGSVKLVFTVSDTGMGMTDAFMRDMYTPFSRAVDSRVNRIQGTGLGLAITKQMVDLMEGTIECVSRVKEGTTFTVSFTFPMAPAAECGTLSGTKNILLLDSDPESRDGCAEALERIGARVLPAGDKAKALELLKDGGQAVDAVLIDDKKDGAPNLDTVRELRAALTGNVPVILITSGWTEIEADAVKAGADGAVTPPLLPGSLLNALGKMLHIAEEAAGQEDEAAGVSGARVLIAEDNDTNWEIISELLSFYDIDSERAENGRLLLERLETAQPGEFDLIFMDVQMPEMNGIEAAIAIRESKNAVFSRIPIYAMTADAFSEDVTRCMNAGMNGHIAKPVDMKQVLSAIKKVKEEQKHD